MDKYLGIFILALTILLSGCNRVGMNTQTAVKQNTLPKFADFSIGDNFGEDLVKPAEVDLNSHPEALNYKTILTEAEKNGPNFNYSYTIAEWSCGTECHSIAIIDSSNGKVYFPEVGYNDGLSYNINSRLIIVNPPQDINEVYGNDPQKWPDWLSTKYYVWENNDLRLIKEVKVMLDIIN